jgi:hypothetical protein
MFELKSMKYTQRNLVSHFVSFAVKIKPQCFAMYCTKLHKGTFYERHFFQIHYKKTFLDRLSAAAAGQTIHKNTILARNGDPA